MAFSDTSPVDDGWCLSDEPVSETGAEPVPYEIEYAPDMFTEAYWLQVEQRCPAFFVSCEAKEFGSFGDRMEQAAARLQPRLPTRAIEDWEERFGG